MVTDDAKYQCDLEHVTENYLISGAKGLAQKQYTVELSYKTKGWMDKETFCDSEECSFMVPVPNVSMESSERPRSRIEDGRRKPGYQEPPLRGSSDGPHGREGENIIRLSTASPISMSIQMVDR